MILSNLLIVLLFTTINCKPLAKDSGQQSTDSDGTQWSSVPEVDESSMMQLINSIMEMIRSQLSGWMYGSRSNDDVEVDSSNRGFLSMVHGLFSRLSNMAIDMMGQMRKMRGSANDRLQDSPIGSDSTAGAHNSSTIATRLKNQMENTRDRIKDAWNNLMKRYNNTMSSVASAMNKAGSTPTNEDQIIDDELKANSNLRSDNRRVIRSVKTVGDDDGQYEIMNAGYINSVEPKVLDKLVSMVDRLPIRKSDSLSAQSSSDEDNSGSSLNLFNRMRGAMDNARSKFFGAIGKFMNGTLMNEPEDDSTNLTENDGKNWWQKFKPKPTKIPEREPLSPRGYIPTIKNNYPPSTIPKEFSTTRNNYPDLSSIPTNSYKPQGDWTVKSYPRIVPTADSKIDLDGDEQPSRTTIEFMDKFKGEIEKVRTSMDTSENDNLEMAMAKMANWGLFIRSITESKNLDDFWVKITQQIN